VLVAFDTPVGGLVSGADLQTFRVLVRKTGTANPTVDVALYEDGVEVATLVSGTSVTSSTGQVVTATWNAASLADSTGADVECYVYGHSSGTSQVEIGAIAWDAYVGGIGAATLPLLTASGAGTVTAGTATLEGTGAATLPLLTASGAGAAWTTLAGEGAATLPLLTASGAGTILELLEGSGTPSLPLLTASGSGAAWTTLAGSGEATLPLLTASGAGEVSEKAPVSGSGAATLPLLTASGEGVSWSTYAGSGTPSLPLLTASGSGDVRVLRQGSGTPSLPLLTASGAGKAWTTLEGAGTPSLPLLTASGAGTRIAAGVIAGSGTASLPILTAAGEGLTVKGQSATGGWASVIRAEQAREKAKRERWKREDEEELAELIRRNERLKAAEATVERALEAAGETAPAGSATDLKRLEALTSRYAAITDRDQLARRAQRALEYAERSRTQMAYELALRELARSIEEEELAVLLLIASA
jgi:hypothetical protein